MSRENAGKTVKAAGHSGNTHRVIGAQRVERVCPAHEQPSIMAQQHLYVITTLLLQQKAMEIWFY